MTIGSEGQVFNPASANLSDGGGALFPPTQGKQGEYIVRELSGKYFTGALRKNLFSFNVTAQAIPVVAATLASVYTLWNPPSSGVIGELVDTEFGQVVAATVVDTIGWYFSSGPQALAGTFSVASVANTNHFAARIGDTPTNQIAPYTHYTHSGTPVRVDIAANCGAATNTTTSVISKLYDGRILIPPGVAMSIAMSTTVGSTAGMDISSRWLEWPFA